MRRGSASALAVAAQTRERSEQSPGKKKLPWPLHSQSFAHRALASVLARRLWQSIALAQGHGKNMAKAIALQKRTWHHPGVGPLYGPTLYSLP